VDHPGVDLLPATMSPPRHDTRRCTVIGPPGWGGSDRARRAPRSQQEHGVSRVTVCKAIDALRRQGLVVTLPQRGTYVK
jgi:hypothetical protein